MSLFKRSVRHQLSCREVGRLVQRFLDDELDDADAALVAGHLDACLRCGMDAGTYRWLSSQLSDAAAPADPRQLGRLRAFAEEVASGPV